MSPIRPDLPGRLNREILESHGFYDAGIVGSGDSLMAAAIYGRYDAVIKSNCLVRRVNDII